MVFKVKSEKMLKITGQVHGFSHKRSPHDIETLCLPKKGDYYGVSAQMGLSILYVKQCF